MHLLRPSQWNVDVDKCLNPYLPRNLIHRLPRVLSHFLGYREQPVAQIGNVLVAWWAFLGAFVGIAMVESVFMIPAIHNHGVPLLIASSGAASILEFNSIYSPSAQPRSSVVGHTLSVVVGVSVTKLFSLYSDFEKLRWLTGALACGLASAVMVLTDTVFPPGGATALLAAVDPGVQHLGWWLVPLIVLSTFITLLLSLFVNNIHRRYPTYWWTPADLGLKREEAKDLEKSSESDKTFMEETKYMENVESCMIKITPNLLLIPENIYLTPKEKDILESLKDRLVESLSTPSKRGLQPLGTAQSEEYLTREVTHVQTGTLESEDFTTRGVAF